jgi:hypothetical protein
MAVDADYLVTGAGASALAFVDAMLRESDATFVIVDKGTAPGGHWNQAYPFVRLHQPSSFYGAMSRQLGHDRIDEAGFNAGLRELASGFEVADHFHQLMRDTFLPSGRVAYFPVSEVIEADPQSKRATFVSLLSRQRHAVKFKRKLVDATVLGTEIPLTHTRNFTVASGVVCVPPNDLPHLATQYRRFTILGGGKTAIDSLLWLLGNGAPHSAIRWVLPRDAWMLNRANQQPGLAFFEQSIGGIAKQYEIAAAAQSIDEFCESMGAAGLWLQLDPAIRPTMMHAANVTVVELEQLRQISNMVRMGRVKSIATDKLELTDGTVAADPDTLYVDCTAKGVANHGDRSPVFAPNLIRLQMIRQGQPTFSAALIGHIEATIRDDADKQPLTQVTAMGETPADYVRTMAYSIANQAAWNANPAIRAWLRTCRLDGLGRTVAEVDPADIGKRAILARIGANAELALKNLTRLSAS